VAYTFTSDRNKKENLRTVNAEEVLQKVRNLDVTSWNYIGHDPQRFRHYGPMAQDFFAAFGHDGAGTVGTSTTITSGDVDGVLLLAMKAVEQRTADLRRENALLRASVDELRGELNSRRPGFTAARTTVASEFGEQTSKGAAVLDSNGEAWVTLPLGFEAVHILGGYHYQLTAIGAPGASLYVAEEVRNGRFKIAGGRPGAKVSWQVSTVGLDSSGVVERR